MDLASEDAMQQLNTKKKLNENIEKTEEKEEKLQAEKERLE